MTEAQSWTFIIGALTAVFALTGIITTSFTRILRAELNSVRSDDRAELHSLRSEMVAGFGALRTELHTEIGGLRAEMMDRFASVDRGLDDLDRDVQALTKKVFHQPE